MPTAEGLTAPELDRLVPLVRPAAILAAPGIALPTGAPCPVLADLAALMDHAPGAHEMGEPDRLAYLVFTSGSSGQPKPVRPCAPRRLGAAHDVDGWYGLRPDDRMLHAGAFNWTYTLGTGLLDPWAIGATALIPAPGTAPEALALLMKRHDARSLPQHPACRAKIVAAGPRRSHLPRLRHALAAGEKLPETLRARLAGRGPATEDHEAPRHVGMLHLPVGQPRAAPHPRGHSGYPQPGGRLAIVDWRDGVEVAAGRDRHPRHPPQRSRPYAGLPDEGAPDLPLTGDWFLTGDLVSADPDGALRTTGRPRRSADHRRFSRSALEIEGGVPVRPRGRRLRRRRPWRFGRPIPM